MLCDAAQGWEQTGEDGARLGKEPGEMGWGWGDGGRDDFNTYFINHIYIYILSLATGGEIVEILSEGLVQAVSWSLGRSLGP